MLRLEMGSGSLGMCWGPFAMLRHRRPNAMDQQEIEACQRVGGSDGIWMQTQEANLEGSFGT